MKIKVLGFFADGNDEIIVEAVPEWKHGDCTYLNNWGRFEHDFIVRTGNGYVCKYCGMGK
jgi:hypothetical protein